MEGQLVDTSFGVAVFYGPGTGYTGLNELSFYAPVSLVR